MTQTLRFEATPTPGGTEFRLFEGPATVPAAHWALSGHPGVALCSRWLVADEAVEDGDVMLVEHAAIARLTAAEALRLDLPAATALRAVVEGSGVMVRPGFTVSLRWARATGQTVLGVQRAGAWLQEAAGWRRLPETLFAVAEAVDRHTAAKDEAARLAALVGLRGALPAAALSGTAEASGLLGSVTIIEADALSLDSVGEGDAIKIIPVLHRAGAGDASAPLLPEDRQRMFGEKQFHQWPAARPVYSLPGGVYVTIAPPLRQALDVVLRIAARPAAERRAFLREPRAAIRAAIGDEADPAVIENLVIETPTWSDRVIGLGLWEPRVLPWIMLQGNDWFDRASAAPQGLTVDGQSVPLTPDAAATLAAQVKDAAANGQSSVSVDTPDGPVDLPTGPQTQEALAALQPQAERPEFVIIRPNETARDIEVMALARPAPAMGLPRCLHTTLKSHQAEGLEWLQRSWQSGSPGVLLADDMGLGKTLQGLAFLAWLKEGMRAGGLATRPVLIVAPTGLLQNWLAEHDRHLNPPRLGEPVLAFGRELAALRSATETASGRLDVAALQAADWVLTTFETLRDHIVDFGAVHFAAVLMDEAQKIKTPAIRTTDAAKAVRADFRIAMTGTPVENRLADLWCIVDCVAPGMLGDLRGFSQRYEGDGHAERLPGLKSFLDRPGGGQPPVMLRRMKEDRLPDLPHCTEHRLAAPMTGPQLAAYEAAVEYGRSHQGPGRVLEALQRLRAVSLHADLEGTADDAALVAGSVRLQKALEVLDAIAAKGERALIFVERLAMMERLIGLLQRRYRLPAPPAVISGAVSGRARHGRVQHFQDGAGGFDVMLISPKAGGVGLNITRANHVLHLTRWWNPAIEDQCTARALRIGQERPVSVYLFLATLPNGRPSFDENLDALLGRKRRLTRDALAPVEADAGELAAMLRETVG